MSATTDPHTRTIDTFLLGKLRAGMYLLPGTLIERAELKTFLEQRVIPAVNAYDALCAENAPFRKLLERQVQTMSTGMPMSDINYCGLDWLRDVQRALRGEELAP